MSWPQRYRHVLQESASRPLHLDDEQAEAVLRLAKEVAHGSERRYAPVATFLAGQFVVSRVQDGVGLSEALEEAVSLAQQLLPQIDQK